MGQGDKRAQTVSEANQKGENRQITSQGETKLVASAAEAGKNPQNVGRSVSTRERRPNQLLREFVWQGDQSKYKGRKDGGRGNQV